MIQPRYILLLAVTLLTTIDAFCAIEDEAKVEPVGVLVAIPEFWRIKELEKQSAPSRLAMFETDEKSTTLVSVMDHYLDLPYQVKNNTLRGGKPTVPFAPEMVVGEGPDPDNYTIVKRLNKYGIAELTFLAYPPSVRGGVQVAAGQNSAGVTILAVAPIADKKTKEIRLFNKNGGAIGSFKPNIPPPYRIAIGDFLGAKGDELAVCSRTLNLNSTMSIMDFDGKILETRNLPADLIGEITMTSNRTTSPASIILFSEQARATWIWSPEKKPMLFKNEALAGKLGVCGDAFTDDLLLLENDPVVSNLTAINVKDGKTKRLNVSQYENRFWVVTPPKDAKPGPAGATHPPNMSLASLEEGTYVKFCKYGHKRMDARSPGYKNPQFGSSDPKVWTGEASAPDLAVERLTMWNPCFTHRGFPQLLDKWGAAKDPVSGLPKYMMVGRNNALDSYVEGKSNFSLTSYALDVPDLDHVYLDTLSAFLRNLATRFREHPERMPSLEPNHENEIPLKVNGTFGDYNPSMVQGFFYYLNRMYGGTDKINAKFGTPFKEFFDAPRNMERGAWDKYGMENLYFKEWNNYNRMVVNARLAQGFRESLLAGFPPELIKTHQIPDLQINFSNAQTRITPSDYVLSSGIGGGYTRYGVWYKNKDNFLKGSHSSGHDSVVLGEYNSLAKDNDSAAKQLQYMYDHGVQGINVMGWTEEIFNQTITHAVRELVQQNRPRPGGAGGVSEVKAFVEGKRRFNIAVLGTSPDHVGLIKSLNADGTWEGSVYVAPFKAHTDIQLLKEVNTRQVISVGPIDNFNGGSQIELTFKARGTGTLEYQVCRGDTILPGLQQTFTVSGTSKSFRIIHRTQIPSDGISLKLVMSSGSVVVSNFSAILHATRFANVHRGIMEGQRHKGGLTFDILSHRP